MTALKHLAEWIWKQLEKLHLLYWLLELLGWQKIVFSTFVAIALALEAKSEHLPLTYIILIGLFSFTLVMVLVETGLRLYKRMRPTQPRIPAHPPSTGANHRPEMPIPHSDEEIFLEGELSLDTMTWKARVPFRQPFLRTPEVTLLCRADGRATDEPSIDKVTVDYFEVSTNDSRVTGKWFWRAKGVLSGMNRIMG